MLPNSRVPSWFRVPPKFSHEITLLIRWLLINIYAPIKGELLNLSRGGGGGDEKLDICIGKQIAWSAKYLLGCKLPPHTHKPLWVRWGEDLHPLMLLTPIQRTYHLYPLLPPFSAKHSILSLNNNISKNIFCVIGVNDLGPVLPDTCARLQWAVRPPAQTHRAGVQGIDLLDPPSGNLNQNIHYSNFFLEKWKIKINKVIYKPR